MIIAKTKQYLEESRSLKVDIEELDSLLGPDGTEVDFERILEEAEDEKGCAIFETFITDGPSEFLVVSFAMGQAATEAERTVARRFVCFFK